MRNRIEILFAVGALSFLGLTTGCTVEVGNSTAATAGSGGGGNAGGSGGAGAAGNGGAAAGGTAGTDAGLRDVTAGDAPTSDVGSDAVTVDTSAGDSVSMPDAPAEGSLPDALVPADGTLDAARSDISTDAIGDGAHPGDGSTCLDEDKADSGTPVACDTLSYYLDICSDDAGDPLAPAGAALCDTLRPSLKLSAFQRLYECLKALDPATSGTPSCSAAHERAAAQCSESLFTNMSCPVPDSAVDGGAYGCNEIAASCRLDAGSGGASIEVTQCWAWLGPFNRTTRQEIIDCYLDPQVTGATSCRDKFENFCAFPE